MTTATETENVPVRRIADAAQVEALKATLLQCQTALADLTAYLRDNQIGLPDFEYRALRAKAQWVLTRAHNARDAIDRAGGRPPTPYAAGTRPRDTRRTR
jgi:hypothetical protein